MGTHHSDNKRTAPPQAPSTSLVSGGDYFM
jgi:hypothetical protein